VAYTNIKFYYYHQHRDPREIPFDSQVHMNPLLKTYFEMSKSLESYLDVHLEIICSHTCFWEKNYFLCPIYIKDKFWCFKMTIHGNFYVFLPRSRKLFFFPKNCVRTSDVRIYTRKLFTTFEMFKLVFVFFILGSYRPHKAKHHLQLKQFV
jgi:hypothetical protein